MLECPVCKATLTLVLQQANLEPAPALAVSPNPSVPPKPRTYGFKISGAYYELSSDDILRAAQVVSPEHIDKNYTEIQEPAGAPRRYSPKSLVEEALKSRHGGYDKRNFNSDRAVRICEGLGFRVHRTDRGT